MYLEPNNPSLSFADFLEAAIRDKAEKNHFLILWRCADAGIVLIARTVNALSIAAAVLTRE